MDCHSLPQNHAIKFKAAEKNSKTAMLKTVLIIPAACTPIVMANKAFLVGISMRVAAKEPDQAPVPGKGTATSTYHKPKIPITTQRHLFQCLKKILKKQKQG